MLCGTREGCVEPAVEVESEHGIIGNGTHVDKHIFPLSALRLVARHGVAVFHLQGIEESVFFLTLSLFCTFSVNLPYRGL